MSGCMYIFLSKCFLLCIVYKLQSQLQIINSTLQENVIKTVHQLK